MKTTLFGFVLILVLVCVKVIGVPQGKNVEEKDKHESTPDGHPVPVKKIRDEIPQVFLKNGSVPDWKNAFQVLSSSSNNKSGLGNGGGGLSIYSIYNTLLSTVHSLYQDLLNRQQAFINLLTCGNCVNEGWNAIMEVALTVPELDWIQKPSPNSPATFFTAVHQNGTVTGIGGSIVNNKPVAEYAFGNDGIVQRLPNKQAKN